VQTFEEEAPRCDGCTLYIRTSINNMILYIYNYIIISKPHWRAIRKSLLLLIALGAPRQVYSAVHLPPIQHSYQV